jgi:hypothetical protein
MIRVLCSLALRPREKAGQEKAGQTERNRYNYSSEHCFFACGDRSVCHQDSRTRIPVCHQDSCHQDSVCSCGCDGLGYVLSVTGCVCHLVVEYESITVFQA